MENPSTNAVEQDSIKAIGMMSLAVFLLSAMDLALKQLVEHYPSMQVVFLRCITSAPLLASWMLVRDRKGFRVKFPADHLLREVPHRIFSEIEVHDDGFKNRPLITGGLPGILPSGFLYSKRVFIIICILCSRFEVLDKKHSSCLS